MSYTIYSTEKTKKKASEFETKALLYLMTMHKDSSKIHYFVVDFFNDLTGVDSLGLEAWDTQSKGSAGITPKAIGKDLVTLFKNYLSEFEFKHYIMFLGGVSQTVLLDETLKEFTIENVTPKAKKSIISGLIDESYDKEYIKKDLICDANINDFLSKVLFVIGDYDINYYIRQAIKVGDSFKINDEYLTKIFNEIRDKQSSLKHIMTENVILNNFIEFEKYNKYLTSNDIKLMILSRLIHRNGIEESVPISFSILLDGRTEVERKDLVETCQDDIFRMLYDKNNADAYWELFEEVYNLTLNNIGKDINYIYELLDKDKVRKVTFLTFNSTKYFISLVKDGLCKW